MAAPAKKRAINPEDFDDSNSSGDESNNSEKITGQEEIQVDFEGRCPLGSDFHGIKQLLHQLFLKAHINLSELTDIIINQNNVGSVIKQSYDDDADDDDEEGDDGDADDPNDVFGITTVVNLTENPHSKCITQLRELLLELSQEHGSEQVSTYVKKLLQDDNKPVGLLINERFVNIPAQITVPLLKSLSNEIKKAVKNKLPFGFCYYVLICKLYKLDAKKSKKKMKDDCEIIWSNPEEEYIQDELEASFEFSVKNDSDSGLSGRWSESDAEMTPYRKVIIFDAEHLDKMIDKIESIIKIK